MKENECNYTECEFPATETFGLVPLCEDHCKQIWKETIDYYQPKRLTMRMTYYGRKEFHQISHLIPWSTAMKERM